MVIDRGELKVPPASGDSEVVHRYLTGVELMLGQRSAQQQLPVRLVVGRLQGEVLGTPFCVKIQVQVKLRIAIKVIGLVRYLYICGTMLDSP